MKGLYFNIPGALAIAANDDRLLGASGEIAHASHHGHEIVVSHRAADWPDGPILKDEKKDLTIAGSGWLLLQGKLGNLRALADGFLSATDALTADGVLLPTTSGEALRAWVNQIEAGAFVVLILRGSERWLLTDPFALHPHYHRTDDPLKEIAPAPRFLLPPPRGDARSTRGGRDSSGSRAAEEIISGFSGSHKAVDPSLFRGLERQGHLFGNYTAFRGIERLSPGMLYGPQGTLSYFDYGAAELERPAEIGPSLLASMQGVLDQLQPRPRLLPLSGGLDSRLLLILGKMDYGYTYGPRHTGDRPVARRFAGGFGEYEEFSLLDLDYPQELFTAGRHMFEGVCAKPFLELLPVYRRLHQRWGSRSPLFLDGYCGDVLQRGIYLTWGGVRGSLAKLVPYLGRRRFDPHRRLDERYPALDDPIRRLLHESFDRESRSWAVDPFRKVTLYELLFGRGARYTLNGGTILSGQYFTPLQPFLFHDAFRLLWSLDLADVTSYKALRQIWLGLPKHFSAVRTYSGFKPVWHHDIARTTMLVTKSLARKRILKTAIGYESELRAVHWHR